MKITYIAHSGFLAELEHTILLFDYYQGEVPELPGDKKLYVFASHRHPDHFNPEIFQLAKDREQVWYVLSHDIWKSRVPEEWKARTVHLKPGTEWEHEGVGVQTLRSTDEGVAFLVQAEGKTLYHAGDLNDWRWEGEPENWNRQMEEKFHRYIEPLRGKHMDAAFVPLDPRQEKNYALGLDYFLSLADPLAPLSGADKIYPMHCWDKYAVIDRWLAEHPDSPYRERIVRIRKRGEVFW
ncbi:MAG TPA: MBL fold metallo-hydrolase [Candidatus Merdisoma merdipullorum]|nr:MBL fold metallo-hydrolase [Candidatus Merdisoma merdipullorum]